MFRLYMPLDTSWFGFTLGIMICGLVITFYAHTRKIITTRQSLIVASHILGIPVICYLVFYNVDWKWSNGNLVFSLKSVETIDWFGVVAILVLLLSITDTCYAWHLQAIDPKRGTVLLGFFLSFGINLVFLWYYLTPSTLSIQMPNWFRLPTSYDTFYTAIAMVTLAEIGKIIADFIRQRSSLQRTICRVIGISLIGFTSLVLWYSLTPYLIMPTLSDSVILILGLILTPLLGFEMFVRRKNSDRRINLIGIAYGLFLGSLIVGVIWNNALGVILLGVAHYVETQQSCNATPLYQTVVQWNPTLNEPKLHVIACGAVQAQVSPLPQHNNSLTFLSNRDGGWQIYTMQPNGSDQRPLLTGAAKDAISGLNWTPALIDFHWSPNGEALAFSSQHDEAWEMYLMKADGSLLAPLSRSMIEEGSPEWSPDGHYLLYGSTREGDQHLYLMDADGSHLHRLETNTANATDGAWSPDGKKIVFTSGYDGSQRGNTWNLYTINPDGTGQQQLTNSSSAKYGPVWSPDGKHIAFMLLDRGQNIATIDADGTNLRRLVECAPALCGRSSWSPDGNYLAFEANPKGSWGVFVVNQDGTGIRRLTDPTSDNGAPKWRP